MARMMNINPIKQWLCGLCLLIVLLNVDAFPVKITILDSAVAKGAVCLDGSPPAYHIVKGSGDGVNKWLVHLEGGAWCNDVADCKHRAITELGTTKLMGPAYYNGILNNGSNFNPDFYNWNRIKIRYCDGSSYMSDIEEVDPAINLHFRGARILKVMVDELLSLGMKDADQVVLSGCSAGALGVILNCDRFKTMLSSKTKFKCVADGGYFANIKDVSGAGRVESYYDEVVNFHKLAKNLPESCTSKMKPSLCFFPQNVVPQIQTPIFFVNPAYDVWQIGVNYAPDSIKPLGYWTACKNNVKKCSADQMKSLQNFSMEFLNAFKAGVNSPSREFFVNGCYTHCQTETQDTWFQADSPKIGGKTIANAVGDWVNERSPPFQVYGAPYPCDETCHNFVNPPINGAKVLSFLGL